MLIVECKERSLLLLPINVDARQALGQVSLLTTNFPAVHTAYLFHGFNALPIRIVLFSRNYLSLQPPDSGYPVLESILIVIAVIVTIGFDI